MSLLVDGIGAATALRLSDFACPFESGGIVPLLARDSSSPLSEDRRIRSEDGSRWSGVFCSVRAIVTLILR